MLSIALPAVAAAGYGGTPPVHDDDGAAARLPVSALLQADTSRVYARVSFVLHPRIQIADLRGAPCFLPWSIVRLTQHRSIEGRGELK